MQTQLSTAARGTFGSPVVPDRPAGFHSSGPQALDIRICFQGGGTSPLRRRAGGSVAVRRGWEQRIRGWHRVQTALGAPSTRCQRGRGPAGKQDTWGARAKGLGQAQGWGSAHLAPRWGLAPRLGSLRPAPLGAPAPHITFGASPSPAACPCGGLGPFGWLLISPPFPVCYIFKS